MSDWLEQAAQLRDDGEVGKAIDLLEHAVAVGEESSEICKELARLSLSVNEVRAFANWCHESMRIDPSDAEPHWMIGRVLMSRKRWDEAEEAFAQALQLRIEDDALRAEIQTLHSEAAREHRELRKSKPGYSTL